MNIENSPNAEAIEEVPVEDYFDDIKHSATTRGRKIGSHGYGFLDQAKLPFFIGGSALVLIILMVFIFSGKETVSETDRIQFLENKMETLEAGIVKMNRDLEDILLLEKQNKRIDVFMDRYARLEADLSLKVDLLEKKLRKIQTAKKVINKKKSKTLTKKINKEVSAAVKPGKKISEEFHHVRTGETLYSIGKQYGIAVDKLREMNSALKGSGIYPGQKLRIVRQGG